jgi:hypothetical protein
MAGGFTSSAVGLNRALNGVLRRSNHGVDQIL